MLPINAFRVGILLILLVGLLGVVGDEELLDGAVAEIMGTVAGENSIRLVARRDEMVKKDLDEEEALDWGNKDGPVLS